MKKIIALLLVLLTSVLTACGVGGKESYKPLTVGILSDIDSIPIIVADKKGFFKEEGIEVKVEPFKSAKDRDSAFQAGQLDGAVSDVLAAAFAKEGGFDLKITSMTDGSYKLLVYKDAGVNSIADLKGKNVAISTNTIIEYATDMMVETEGLSPEDINKVAIPQMPVRLEMLKNGKVDAATLPEPLASSAILDGAVLLNSTDKLSINPGVLLFSQSAIDSKEKEIKAFYAAYNKAVKYLRETDKAEYMDTLIKEAGFPENIKDALVLPQYNDAKLLDKKDLDDVIKWQVEKNLIKKTYTFEELVDERFTK